MRKLVLISLVALIVAVASGAAIAGEHTDFAFNRSQRKSSKQQKRSSQITVEVNRTSPRSQQTQSSQVVVEVNRSSRRSRPSGFSWTRWAFRGGNRHYYGRNNRYRPQRSGCYVRYDSRHRGWSVRIVIPLQF